VYSLSIHTLPDARAWLLERWQVCARLMPTLPAGRYLEPTTMWYLEGQAVLATVSTSVVLKIFRPRDCSCWTDFSKVDCILVRAVVEA